MSSFAKRFEGRIGTVAADGSIRRDGKAEAFQGGNVARRPSAQPAPEKPAPGAVALSSSAGPPTIIRAPGAPLRESPVRAAPDATTVRAPDAVRTVSDAPVLRAPDAVRRVP